MRVWLVNTGESLPIDTKHRPGRTGMLAARLLAEGHSVEWWGMTFAHVHKKHWFDDETTLDLQPGFRLRLVHGPGYRRNISLARLRHHCVLGERFRRAIESEPPPDRIVCSLPSIELAEASVEYGRRHGVPVILDLRDLWPDIFLDALPGALRPLARPFLLPLRRRLRNACRGASALWGITPAFVDWGLEHAGRARSNQDRHFWHSYRPTVTSKPRSDEFLVAYAGVMSDTFDMETVIEAARRLEKTHPRIRFALFGNGDRLESYRKRATGLSNVSLPGWRDQTALGVLLQEASVGLAPYRNRRDFVMSIPNKPVEYLSAGLPILSGLSGVLGDLIATRQIGLSYENGNVDDFTEKLLRLYDDRALRERLVENGRRLFEDEFTEARVMGGMVDALERTTSAPPA